MSRADLSTLQELSCKAGERNKDAIYSLAIAVLFVALAVVYVFDSIQHISIQYVIWSVVIVALCDSFWSLGAATEYTRLWTEEMRRLREGNRG